jgi:uncharacterized membrane protein YphA (DoxX/SURF4 family)
MAARVGTHKWVALGREHFMDVVRVYLGIGLLAKGIYFVGNASALLETMQAAHVPFTSVALAHYVGLAHIGGGTLLAVGLVTRIAALVQFPVLIGAVFFIHFKQGLFSTGQTLEFSVLVAFLLALYIVLGAGRLSADYYLFEKPAAAEA